MGRANFFQKSFPLQRPCHIINFALSVTKISFTVQDVEDFLCENEELQRRKKYLLFKDWRENVYTPLKVICFIIFNLYQYYEMKMK